MRQKPNFKPLLIWLFIAALIIIVLHFGFSWDYAWSVGVAIIVFVSVFLNGLLATWEDEQPGGFNNPLPDVKKK